MQKRTKIIFAGVLLLASGFYAATEQGTLETQSATRPSEPGFRPDRDPAEPLRVHSRTWELVGPEADRPENAWLNAPEQRRAREIAALSIENPVEFRKRFPKSAQEQVREDAERDAMTYPREYEPIIQAQKTPEQLQDEAWSLDTVLNPLKYQEVNNQPNQESTIPQ
jgi:hypothetical protein